MSSTYSPAIQCLAESKDPKKIIEEVLKPLRSSRERRDFLAEYVRYLEEVSGKTRRGLDPHTAALEKLAYWIGFTEPGTSAQWHRDIPELSEMHPFYRVNAAA